jgi:hypothetical protein
MHALWPFFGGMSLRKMARRPATKAIGRR